MPRIVAAVPHHRVGHMNGCLCKRCNRFWSMGGNPDLFQVIGELCPDCIEQLAISAAREKQKRRQPA